MCYSVMRLYLSGAQESWHDSKQMLESMFLFIYVYYIIILIITLYIYEFVIGYI